MVTVARARALAGEPTESLGHDSTPLPSTPETGERPRRTRRAEGKVAAQRDTVTRSGATGCTSRGWAPPSGRLHGGGLPCPQPLGQGRRPAPSRRLTD